MKQSLSKFMITFMAALVSLSLGVASAQQRNSAQGDGGSLSSPPGAEAAQNSYSGFGQGNYGGYGSGYGYGNGYGSGYGNWNNQSNYGSQPYYGILPSGGTQYPNASGSYPTNYNGAMYGNYGNYGYGNGSYGYNAAVQNQNSYYSGYGYGGYGGYRDSPVEVYYGYPNPSYGNGGYDSSSSQRYQRGSPYSRF